MELKQTIKGTQFKLAISTLNSRANLNTSLSLLKQGLSPLRKLHQNIDLLTPSYLPKMNETPVDFLPETIEFTIKSHVDLDSSKVSFSAFASNKNGFCKNTIKSRPLPRPALSVLQVVPIFRKKTFPKSFRKPMPSFQPFPASITRCISITPNSRLKWIKSAWATTNPNNMTTNWP